MVLRLMLYGLVIGDLSCPNRIWNTEEVHVDKKIFFVKELLGYDVMLGYAVKLNVLKCGFTLRSIKIHLLGLPTTDSK